MSNIYPVARETISYFPTLVREYPQLAANVRATRYYGTTPDPFPMLPETERKPPVRIEVINGDTIDVARTVIFGRTSQAVGDGEWDRRPSRGL